MKVYQIAEVTMAFVFLYLFSFLFEVFTPGVHRAPYQKTSRIKQIQLEQDSGKSLHDAELRRSLVDLNRAGAPLIELVFEPDLQDGEEAAALVKELVLIVRRLGACSGRMEEGALRVDANVSVHREGEPFGTRTEIKNISSIRGIAGAIKYEIERQRSLLERGEPVTQETRSWDLAAKVTTPMRDKELVHDYRYMPEPNLPPLRVNLETTDYHKDIVSVPYLRQQIPELPEETRSNLVNTHKIRKEAAIQIVNEPILLNHFVELAKKNLDPVKISNVLLNEYLAVLHKEKIDIDNSNITTQQLSEILGLISSGTISLEVSKLVMLECVRNKVDSVRELVENKNWSLVSNEEDVIKLCMRIIEENPELVKAYKSGKVKILQALVGRAAKSSDKKYNMSLVAKKMTEILNK